MLDIKYVLEEIDELKYEFYGKEEDDFEGGVFEEDYDCAEWARSNVDGLFATVKRLATEVSRVTNKLKDTKNDLSTATGLLSEAHDLMDDVHCYDTELYREISRYFNGDEQ
jgi:archaellum component FlaC